jgi:hypothetical protein
MACYGLGANEEIINLPAGTVDIDGGSVLNCCSCPGGGGGGETTTTTTTTTTTSTTPAPDCDSECFNFGFQFQTFDNASANPLCAGNFCGPYIANGCECYRCQSASQPCP